MAAEAAAVDAEILGRLATGRQGEVPPALAAALLTDGLTGLYSRMYFQARLEREIARASRERPLALFFIDLDRFKAANDRFGHDFGDRVLVEVARAIRGAIPPRAVPCRLAGDEFVVLVPDCSPEEVRWLPEQVRQEITRRQVSLAPDRGFAVVGAAVGVAVAPEQATDAAGLFRQADADMYAAKAQAAGLPAGSPLAAEHSTPGAAAPGSLGTPPLVGRDELVARLQGQLLSAVAGRGGLVLLAGPPGIGKSRLLAELTTAAQHSDWAVWQAALVDAGGSQVGGEPLAELRNCTMWLLRAAGAQRARAIVKRHPALRLFLGQPLDFGPLDLLASQGHAALSDGLHRLLAAAATRRPVLLVLDDLHWAHPSWLSVLSHLAPHLRDLPVLVLASARSAGARPEDGRTLATWWQQTGHQQHCQRWEVPPLGRAAALRLARWALGQVVPRAVVAQLPAVAGGNPLHILRLAADPGALRRQTATGPTLAEVYRAQFDLLPVECRRVLTAAAVLGDEFPTAALLQVAPESPEAVARALRTLETRGWFRAHGSGQRFSHSLARETAYGSLAPSLRRSLHRLAGQVVADLGPHSPAALAHHCQEGGDWIAAPAHHLAAGATAERSLAYGEAARHFWHALQMVELTGHWLGDAVAVALRTADLFQLAENHAAVQESLRWALQKQPALAERGRALALLANTYRLSGDFDTFAACNGEAARILRPLGPSVTLAQVLMRETRVAAYRGDRVAVRTLARETLAVVSAGVSAPVEAVAIIASLGVHTAEVGELALANGCLRSGGEQLPLAHRHAAGDRHGLARLAMAGRNLAYLALRLGHLARASALSRQAARHAQASGDLSSILTTHQTEILCLVYSGHLEPARAALAAIEAQVLGSDVRLRHFDWLFSLFHCCFYAHDLDSAEGCVHLLAQVGKAMGAAFDQAGAACAARLALARGQSPAVDEWLPAHLLPFPARPATATPVLLTAAEVQLRAGDVSAAATLLAAARQYLVDRYEVPWVEWVAGQVALARGDLANVQAAWRRAVQTRGIAYYRALAHRDLTQWLLAAPSAAGAGRRRIAQAAAHWAMARLLFTRMGNAHETSRLTQLAQRHQLSAAPAGAPPSGGQQQSDAAVFDAL